MLFDKSHTLKLYLVLDFFILSKLFIYYSTYATCNFYFEESTSSLLTNKYIKKKINYIRYLNLYDFHQKLSEVQFKNIKKIMTFHLPTFLVIRLLDFHHSLKY